VVVHERPRALAAPASLPAVDANAAGERWRNALAELEYAGRHGSPADEVEQLVKGVIEARVAMFQAGIARGRALPACLLPAYLQVVVLP
jgi:hypothetical protein